MSMLMNVSQDGTKEKARTSTVRKFKEMRQARRLSLNENVVYHTLWTRPNPFTNGQASGKEAQTLNFSNGGIGLLTTEALKPLEIIQVNLTFSHSGVTIPTIAEVVWAGRRSLNGLYPVGLRYLL
jgi:hypothetical protein